MKIYLVQTVYVIEGSFAFKAFKDEGQALEFCSRCNEYQKTFAPYAGNSYSGKKWQSWMEANEAWLAAHPAGMIGCADPDSYSVTAMDLVG